MVSGLERDIITTSLQTYRRIIRNIPDGLQAYIRYSNGVQLKKAQPLSSLERIQPSTQEIFSRYDIIPLLEIKMTFTFSTYTYIYKTIKVSKGICSIRRHKESLDYNKVNHFTDPNLQIYFGNDKNFPGFSVQIELSVFFQEIDHSNQETNQIGDKKLKGERYSRQNQQQIKPEVDDIIVKSSYTYERANNQLKSRLIRAIYRIWILILGHMFNFISQSTTRKRYLVSRSTYNQNYQKPKDQPKYQKSIILMMSKGCGQSFIIFIVLQKKDHIIQFKNIIQQLIHQLNVLDLVQEVDGRYPFNGQLSQVDFQITQEYLQDQLKNQNNLQEKPHHQSLRLQQMLSDQLMELLIEIGAEAEIDTNLVGNMQLEKVQLLLSINIIKINIFRVTLKNNQLRHIQVIKHQHPGQVRHIDKQFIQQVLHTYINGQYIKYFILFYFGYNNQQKLANAYLKQNNGEDSFEFKNSNHYLTSRLYLKDAHFSGCIGRIAHIAFAIEIKPSKREQTILILRMYSNSRRKTQQQKLIHQTQRLWQLKKLFKLKLPSVNSEYGFWIRFLIPHPSILILEKMPLVIINCDNTKKVDRALAIWQGLGFYNITPCNTNNGSTNIIQILILLKKIQGLWTYVNYSQSFNSKKTVHHPVTSSENDHLLKLQIDSINYLINSKITILNCQIQIYLINLVIVGSVQPTTKTVGEYKIKLPSEY
ncbi:hypothetical protein pb186bvf_005332 [Paramecium bursaria]